MLVLETSLLLINQQRNFMKRFILAIVGLITAVNALAMDNSFKKYCDDITLTLSNLKKANREMNVVIGAERKSAIAAFRILLNAKATDQDTAENKLISSYESIPVLSEENRSQPALQTELMIYESMDNDSIEPQDLDTFMIKAINSRNNINHKDEVTDLVNRTNNLYQPQYKWNSLIWLNHAAQHDEGFLQGSTIRNFDNIIKVLTILRSNIWEKNLEASLQDLSNRCGTLKTKQLSIFQFLLLALMDDKSRTKLTRYTDHFFSNKDKAKECIEQTLEVFSSYGAPKHYQNFKRIIKNSFETLDPDNRAKYLNPEALKKNIAKGNAAKKILNQEDPKDKEIEELKKQLENANKRLEELAQKGNSEPESPRAGEKRNSPEQPTPQALSTETVITSEQSPRSPTTLQTPPSQEVLQTKKRKIE